jgi:hypothetical protein
MKSSTICFPEKGDIIFLSNKKRGFGVDLLNGYGGKQKPEDFSALDIAVREFGEEAEVATSHEKLNEVAVIDFFRAEEHLYECHIYFCGDWTGELHETEEMGPPEPFPKNSLPYDRMWIGDQQWLPIICSGQKIRGKMIYDKEMKKVLHFEYKPLEGGQS